MMASVYSGAHSPRRAGSRYGLTHSGEANGEGGRFAHILKHLGLAVAGDIMGDLEVSERPCAESVSLSVSCPSEEHKQAQLIRIGKQQVHRSLNRYT